MRSITSMFGVLGTILATSLTVAASDTSIIHQGVLELGDAIFFYDGSLYDGLPIQGNAGQTVELELRSYDFDPFLAIVGPQGEWLAHNNNISTDNLNAALSFVFPSDGTYYIFVNTYSVTGQGNYILELSGAIHSSVSVNASDQNNEGVFFLNDSPPMPTPVLIQPSNWPNSEEEVGDRPHQPTNLSVINANPDGTIILD